MNIHNKAKLFDEYFHQASENVRWPGPYPGRYQKRVTCLI